MTRRLDRLRSSRGMGRRDALSPRRLRAETLEPRLVLSGFAPWQRLGPVSIHSRGVATASTTVTLSAAADAYVSGAAPLTNYGTSADMLVQNASGFAASDDAEAYLKFDLSGVSGTITKAVLQLTPLATGKSKSPMAVGVQLLADSEDGWAEGSGETDTTSTGAIAWSNAPEGWGNEVWVSTAGVKAARPLSIDVTSLLNQKFNSNRIASFVLEPLSWFGKQHWIDFASRENANAAFQPVLVITTTGGSTNAAPTEAEQPAASNTLGLKDSTLAGLVQSLDADGSISRDDMLAILRNSANTTDGIVTSTDLADLKTILNSAAALNMPNYVQVLAADVITGNLANAYYQGKRLGNLAVGSTATQLAQLVSKWFLGTDHPATGGYSYSTVSGSLYTSSGPSHADEYQGNLGDCYLISSLGTIADSSQAAIRNMIIDNGVDSVTGVHTWTVRFYANGKADYVTVDDKLPTDGRGYLVFQGDGSSVSNPKGLWIALVEKAYAQWNETGNEGRDGRNSYASIEGGWMADVDAQVLGRNAKSYNLISTADQQALVAAVAGKMAVTIGTVNSNKADGSLAYGLYGNHAYGVIGYNSSTKTFTLYNPWGSNQPAKSLTWAELKSVCDGFVVADTSGTTPMVAAGVARAMVRPLVAPPSLVQPVAEVAPAASSPTEVPTQGDAESQARTGSSAAVATLADRAIPVRSSAAASSIDLEQSGTDLSRSTVARDSRFGSSRGDLTALASDAFFQTIGSG